MRRWLTGGSLWGLLLYMSTWPLWWLILKSPEQGAQSFLQAAMEAELGRGEGGRLIKECREVDYLRKDVKKEEIAKALWEFSEKQIEALEREGAIRRKLAKTEEEGRKDNTRMTDNTDDAPTTALGTGARAPQSRRSRKAG